MLYPRRFRVCVVGEDGFIRTDHADHILEIPFVDFLLRKQAKGQVTRVTYRDLHTGKPVTAEELHAQ